MASVSLLSTTTTIAAPAASTPIPTLSSPLSFPLTSRPNKFQSLSQSHSFPNFLPFPHSKNPHIYYRDLCRPACLDRLPSAITIGARSIPVPTTSASLLSSCSRSKSLPTARILHSHIISNTLHRNEFVVQHPVQTYADCGSLGDASKVFDEMTRKYWNIHLEEMMEAGVHFGHDTKKWNPKMTPYISGKRKGIHMINLTRTARFLSEACDLVFDAASKRKNFLIVGTKNKVADLVASAAIRARCHYVNKKWLGGMLTNWSTTETRLLKFRDLRAEQKMGKLSRLPKRDAAMVKRKLSTLQTYLGGIKYMTGLPDIVIIVDQQEEYTALRECVILGIPTICLIDTNCDPDLADISIPANDDAIASIRLILNKLVSAICEGRSSYIRSR